MAGIPSEAENSLPLKPFFGIWSGQAVSLLGSQLVQFAIVWYLARTTGSATVLALASLVAILPQIIIGPFAGAMVDRWSRRWIMVLADTSIAVATLALAILFWLDKAAIWNIYGLLLIRSAGSAFHWPAMQSSTTLMVPQKHLGRIAGLNQTLSGVANIFIPPLGALVVEILPMQGVLAIDVLTAIPAVIPLLFIPVPQPIRAAIPDLPGKKPRFWSDLREGLDFVVSSRGLLLLAIIGLLIGMLGRAAASLAPLLVLNHFQGGAKELGWFQSVVGTGSLLGGVLLSVWGGFRRRVVTQMLAMLLDGVAIVAIGLSPQNAFLFALALIFVVGFLETVAIGIGGALFQVIVPPEIQGRVFGLMLSLTQAFSPLGLLLAGPTADAFGVPFWFVLTGIIFILIGITGLSLPDVIHIEEYAHINKPVTVEQAKI